MLGLTIRAADRAVQGLLGRLLLILHGRLLGSLLLEGNQGNGSSVSHNLSHSMKDNRIGNVVSILAITLGMRHYPFGPILSSSFLSQSDASTEIIFTPMFQKFKGKATVRLR